MPGLVIGSPLSFVGEAEIGATDAGASDTPITPTVGSLLSVSVAAAIFASTLLTPFAGEAFFGVVENTDRITSVGTLTLDGIAPLLRTDNRISPSAGELALTPIAPTLLTDFRLTPLVGQATLTFQAPSLLVDAIRGPPAGAVALTGESASLLHDARITPSVGALTLTGYAPVLSVPGDSAITPSAGSLSASGASASVLADNRITPTVGSIAASGVAPSTLQQNLLTPTAGTLAASGYAPGIGGANTDRSPQTGSLFFGLATDESRTPTPSGLTLVGFAPHITSISIAPPAGSLSASGVQAIVGAGLPVPVATHTLTPFAPLVLVNALVSTQTGPTLSITGIAPVGSRSVEPIVGSLSLTGSPPLPSVNSASPAVGSLELVGYAPSVSIGSIVGPLEIAPKTGELVLGLGVVVRTPVTGLISLTGNVPVLDLIGTREVTPQVGALSLVGRQPQVLQNVTLIVPKSGELKLSTNPTPLRAQMFVIGQSPLVARGITTATASLSLAGVAPTVTATTGEITPGTAALILSGQAAPVEDTRIFPATGSLALDGAQVSAGPGIQPLKGALVIAMGDPTSSSETSRVPATAALTTAASAPGVASTSPVFPASGALSLAGTAPVILFSPVIVPQTGTALLVGALPNVDAPKTPLQGSLAFRGDEPVLVQTGPVPESPFVFVPKTPVRSFPSDGQKRFSSRGKARIFPARKSK